MIFFYCSNGIPYWKGGHLRSSDGSPAPCCGQKTGGCILHDLSLYLVQLLLLRMNKVTSQSAAHFQLAFFWKPQSNLRWRTNRKKENVFLAKHYEQIADFVLWKIVHRRVFLLRWRYWVQANKVESTSRNLAAKVTANAIGAWAVLDHVDTGRTAQVLGIHLHNSQNSCKKMILKVDGIHFIL